MERIELELINEICENQNFDELLLKIVHKSNSKNRITNLLNEIENNKTITRQLKMKLYEEIFEYVSDVNDYLKNNLKEIFLIASEKIIAEINNNLGGNVDMLEKIRVIIAEDKIVRRGTIMDINCKKKIQSVKLNLQNGQVEIILRALELYKYNLNYMLDTEQCSDTERQEKLAMVQLTFEQVLSIQAEQVNGKSVDTETTTSQFSKAMPENNLLEDIIPIDKKFKVC